MRADRLARDPRCEGRATDAEKRRARRSHSALCHKRPGEPPTSSIVCGRQKNVYAVAIALGEIQRHVLLRKEVIQPHLPIRLPCYDFVPIASPTFDHSLPLRGWAVGFGCYRLS